ncbi:MAG: PrsW family intramembrane metalloprotease [Euryarchaeota archaeon]|nr:PrsW family intramembrane metalloprotease [Euryarchaeota archaeon]
MVAPALVAAIAAAAFLPPIVFIAYIRNQEKTRREPWSTIVGVFVFGAVVSILIALALESVLHTEEREYQLLDGGFRLTSLVVLVVIIAPVVEEFAKGLALRGARKNIVEEEDGIVYGAAAGFGFSATENLFYELAALEQSGQASLIATAIVRTFTGCFLHATASGILGYGVGKMYRHRRGIAEALPYYAVAVLLHAAFNLIAVTGVVLAAGFTVIIAFLAMRYTVNRIRTLDAVPTFVSDRGPL